MSKRGRLPRGKLKGRKNRLTMTDVYRMNRESGRYFFSPDTMRFFDSRVESDLFANRYFVTSEKRSGAPDLGLPAGERLFTIRVFDPKTGNVDSASEFQEFKTRAQAVKKAKELAGVV